MSFFSKTATLLTAYGVGMNGKPNIFPVLRYDDAPAAIDFLVKAMGFEVKTDHRLPDGSVAHADLAFGPSGIGVSSRQASSPESPWAHVRQGLYIVVSDPDALYERARVAGAEVATPIVDQPYGSREFGLRDPEGHLWGFGTYEMSQGIGAPQLYPEVLYRNGVAAVEWLENAVGFRRSLIVPGEAGSIKHAELRLADGVVFIGSAPESSEFRGLTHFSNLRVADPDAHCARARSAGATIVMEPQMSPFGARYYAARDLEGFLWWVSTYEPR
jgi:uncharacterized glyoxalase superfamily protein PhnB